MFRTSPKPTFPRGPIVCPVGGPALGSPNCRTARIATATGHRWICHPTRTGTFRVVVAVRASVLGPLGAGAARRTALEGHLLRCAPRASGLPCPTMRHNQDGQSASVLTLSSALAPLQTPFRQAGVLLFRHRRPRHLEERAAAKAMIAAAPTALLGTPRGKERRLRLTVPAAMLHAAVATDATRRPLLCSLEGHLLRTQAAGRPLPPVCASA